MNILSQSALRESWFHVLCALAVLSGMSIGLFTLLMSTYMAELGSNVMTIGANATIYFLALGMVAIFVGRLIQSWGLRLVMVLGFIITALAAVIIPFSSSITAWFALRALMGAGVACFTVGAQTYLNHNCPDDNRAFLAGIYGLFFAIGLGFGPLLGPQLYAVSPILAFWVGSLLVFSGVLLTLGGIPATSISKSLYRSTIVGHIIKPLYAVFTYGFAEATFFSLYSVFLLRQGYSVVEMGWAFSVFVIGGIISTVPVTRMGDVFGKLLVLQWCLLVGLFSIGGLLLFDSYSATLGFSLLVGGSVGPVYALALAIVGELLAQEDLPLGSSWFTASFSVGSAAGPLLTALVIHYFGWEHIFTAVLSLFFCLLFYLLFQSQQRGGTRSNAVEIQVTSRERSSRNLKGFIEKE